MPTPTFQTTLTFNREDNELREILVGKGISVIDIWRRGAQELLQEITIEEKTEKCYDE